LLVTEINEGKDLVLLVWKGKLKAFTQAYQAQFTAYAQDAYPFNTPLRVDQDPLNWWKVHQGTPNGGILVVKSV
jgi:hypothetical protein